MSSVGVASVEGVRTGIITRDNHYVPRLYLKHFASTSGYLYRYRTMVSRPGVAEWKKVHVNGVGYQEHLYTRALADGDSDEIEQWLNRDFETPAANSIEKVVSDKRLEREDYRLLTRFLAAQIVRTPAFFMENLPRMREFAKKQVAELSQAVASRLEQAKASEESEQSEEPWPNSEHYPLRLTIEPSSTGKSLVKVRTVVGRATWIFAGCPTHNKPLVMGGWSGSTSSILVE